MTDNFHRGNEKVEDSDESEYYDWEEHNRSCPSRRWSTEVNFTGKDSPDRKDSPDPLKEEDLRDQHERPPKSRPSFTSRVKTYGKKIKSSFTQSDREGPPPPVLLDSTSDARQHIARDDMKGLGDVEREARESNHITDPRPPVPPRGLNVRKGEEDEREPTDDEIVRRTDNALRWAHRPREVIRSPYVEAPVQSLRKKRPEQIRNFSARDDQSRKESPNQ